MILRYIMAFMKIALFSTVILILSQISVGHQRICDHVRDVVMHSHIQRPIRWVAERFNYIEGHKIGSVVKNPKAGLQEGSPSPKAGSEHKESEKLRLSGILKHH